MKHEQLRKMITVAMLSALAFLMTYLSHFLPSVVLFLKYDPKDVIIAIGGFIFGPVSALVISFIASLIEMFTISSTGWIGLLMNVLSSASFACTAAIVYKRKKTFGRAVLGICLGSLAMVASMVLWNWFITPIYMHVDRAYVVSLLMPVFVPFNVLKGFLNAAFTVLLYKPLITALRQAGLVKKNVHSQADGSGTGTAKKQSRRRSLLISLCALAGAAVITALMIVFHFVSLK